MANDEMTIIPPSATQVIEFGSFRSPDAALKEAQMVASAFQRKALALKLYQDIGESKHLKVEGWQMLAAMYRVTASIEYTKFIEYGDAHGFEARAVAIYVPTGQQISAADAMCLNDEDKWGAVSKYEWQTPEGGGQKVKVKVGDVAKPLQQLRSMAQTRAQSKVLSNLLKWVAKMGGFASTPAEEMMPGQDGETAGAGSGSTASTAAGPQRATQTGPVVSDPQRNRLFALNKASGRSKEDYAALLRHFGFDDDREVTKAKYEAICSAAQDPNWKPAPASAPKASTGPQTGNGDPTAEIWAEVVRTYKGEANALRALNNAGFESWQMVNVADRAQLAMRLIQEFNA